ncbi:MAG: hypothetical protein SYC29_18495 [Planctomycetota bacterium]|nr:hypothetical protein [Planctomycetota bacterium]
MTDFKKVAAVALLVCTGSATAEIIWDYGPDTGSYGGCWANSTNGQEFAEQVIFDVDMYLTDIHIFTCISSPGGDSRIKILDDDGAGNPGNWLYDWNQQADAWNDVGNDLYEAIYEFDEIVLEANTIYWIGVSGNGWEHGQASVLTPGDGTMAQFNGGTFNFHASVGDQMFQLTGYEVPAPAGLALLGCAGLISRRRRR